jgi:hypothetical protein
MTEQNFENKLISKRIKRPKNYWKDFNNLESAIKSLMFENAFPSYDRIIKGFPGSVAAIRYFGGLRAVANKMGYELCNFYKTKDGHYARSYYEAVFDEFLYSRNIKHLPEGLIDKNYNYRYDFKVDDYFIEIWGYRHTKHVAHYIKKRKFKERLYRKLKLKLIPVEFQLFNGDNATIERNLEKLFLNLGYDIKRKKEFDINKLTKIMGFWNETRIIKEIKNLIIHNGHFPTHKEMRATSGLACAVQRTSSINAFRKLMGFSKVRLPWTDERIIIDIIKIYKDIGKMPTDQYLYKIKRSDLRSAMSKRRGIKHYQEEAMKQMSLMG